MSDFKPSLASTSEKWRLALRLCIWAGIIFFPLGLACLLIGSQFRKIAGWRIHGWYSMIIGVPICIAALASLIFPPSSPPPPLGGLFERILIVIAFAWYVILASRMLIRARGGVRAPGQ